MQVICACMCTHECIVYTMCLHTCVHVLVCTHIQAYVNTCVYMHVCVHISVCIYTGAGMCIYKCICVCIHVCTCVCTCVMLMCSCAHMCTECTCTCMCMHVHMRVTHSTRLPPGGWLPPCCAGSCAPVLPRPPGSSRKLQLEGHSCCARPEERGALCWAGSLDQSAAPQPSPSLLSP